VHLREVLVRVLAEDERARTATNSQKLSHWYIYYVKPPYIGLWRNVCLPGLIGMTR
jgi:hypothetical protein